MGVEHLHGYTLDLGEYCLRQIRPGLRTLRERPTSVTRLHPTRWSRLTLSEWLGRCVAGLPVLLADHVWAGVTAESVVLPLNEEEMNALAWAVGDPPVRLENDCVWVASPGLHQRSVECLPEIRSELTKQTAEEWAVASAEYASRLCRPGLGIAEGTETVQSWLRYARSLLHVVGAMDYLPAPVGNHPTPTCPTPDRTPAQRTRQVRRRSGYGGREGNSHPPPEMLSPARIATRFDLSRSTVYAACRSGALPHYRVPATTGARGKYLFREVDVVGWLESLRVEGGSTTPSASVPTFSGSRDGLFSELDPTKLSRAWQG